MSSRMERLENLLKGINELPDDLLIHILSFLTMKDAAKTSVLSKRWIFLWTYQPNLNFDLHTLLGSRIPVARYLKKDIDMTELDRCKFIKRVDQILQFYRGTKIDSFGVTFPLDGRSAQPVHRWINFVVKKGVEKLYLRFSPTNGYQFHYEECYIFPGGLISQENGPILKHLHLASCILCPPPIFCEFNSLITLHLEDMVLIERDMENVLSNSLKLESWTLVRCVLPNYFRVVGLSHTLKHLTIRTCNNVKKIELHNMNLETFVCIGCDIRKLIFRNVPHLVKANVESMLNDSAAPHAYQRAKDIRSLESITIDMIDMEALYLPVCTTTRSSLEQLQRKKMPEKFDLSFIASIVDDASPFIQKLHLMLHPEPDYSDQRNAEKKWTSGNKHLREVEISGFLGTSWEQVEFVKHVVDYAVALDQLIIRQSRRTYYNHCEWLDYKPKVPWTEDERDMLFHTMQKHIRPDVKIMIV